MASYSTIGGNNSSSNSNNDTLPLFEAALRRRRRLLSGEESKEEYRKRLENLSELLNTVSLPWIIHYIVPKDEQEEDMKKALKCVTLGLHTPLHLLEKFLPGEYLSILRELNSFVKSKLNTSLDSKTAVKRVFNGLNRQSDKIAQALQEELEFDLDSKEIKNISSNVDSFRNCRTSLSDLRSSGDLISGKRISINTFLDSPLPRSPRSKSASNLISVSTSTLRPDFNPRPRPPLGPPPLRYGYGSTKGI